MKAKIKIEIFYASLEKQELILFEVTKGTTIQAAIEQSNILQDFPEIDLKKQSVGIFGKTRDLSDMVNEGDRIEIYRPLIIDPKSARRKRAEKRKKN